MEKVQREDLLFEFTSISKGGDHEWHGGADEWRRQSGEYPSGIGFHHLGYKERHGTFTRGILDRLGSRGA